MRCNTKMFRHLFCAERVIPDILVKIFYVFVGKFDFFFDRVFVGKFDFFFVRFTAMNSAMWLPKSMSVSMGSFSVENSAIENRSKHLLYSTASVMFILSTVLTKRLTIS